jgi:DNA-binding MurR/RpiR family transcriptional regulator
MSICEKLLKFKNQPIDSSPKTIATYFLEVEIEKLQNNGINQIAVECYTTKSSVSRFVRMLGIDDFKYFKHELISERKKISSLESKRNSNIHNGDKYEDILDGIISSLKYDIGEIYHSRNVIIRFVEALKSADRIVVFSSGKTYNDISEFINKMQLKNKNVVHIQNDVLKMSYLETEHKGDLVLFISNKGSHIEEYQNVMKDLQDSKEQIFIICPSYQDEYFKTLGTTIFFKFEYEYDTITSNDFLLKVLMYMICKMID